MFNPNLGIFSHSGLFVKLILLCHITAHSPFPPHFFILDGKAICFDPMVANVFLLCEDGFHEICYEYAKQVDEKNG